MSNEVEKLTLEVLKLNSEIDELGRKSVPLILKCGESLTILRDLYRQSKTKWETWTEKHKDRISSVTIWRYQRIYEISLVKDFKGKPVPPGFKGMTLNQVYEFCELVKKDGKDKSDTPETKSTGMPERKDKPQETSFEKYRSLLSRVQDIQDETFAENETRQLVKCGEVFVEWFSENGGEVHIKTVTPKPPVLPVIEMEDAA